MIPFILFLRSSHISFWWSKLNYWVSSISCWICINLWGGTYTPPALEVIFYCEMTFAFFACFWLYFSIIKFGSSFKASIYSVSFIFISSCSRCVVSPSACFAFTNYIFFYCFLCLLLSLLLLLLRCFSIFLPFFLLLLREDEELLSLEDLAIICNF